MSLSVSTAVQQLRRDGLETDSFFLRGRGVSLSVSAAVEKRWLGDRHFFWRGRGVSLSVSTAVQQLKRDGLETEFFCRGRGVSLSVSGAAEKRWLGDRFFFGGEEVCRCQSVQQLRRDGLETDIFLEGKRCVTNLLSVCSNAAAEKRWPGDRQQFAGGGVCHCQSVQQLRRDGLETETFLEGKRCVTVSQCSNAAAEKRWLGDRKQFGGAGVCRRQTVQQQFSS